MSSSYVSVDESHEETLAFKYMAENYNPKLTLNPIPYIPTSLKVMARLPLLFTRF